MEEERIRQEKQRILNRLINDKLIEGASSCTGEMDSEEEIGIEEGIKVD